MIKRLILTFFCGLVIQGCSTSQRAGDITLASQPVSTESSASTSASNLVTSSGTVLTTDSAKSGKSSQDPASTTKSENADPAVVSNSKLPARTISVTRTKPDCKGSECPVIKVKRLSFSGRARFNAFLDQTMATMVQMDSNQAQTFKSFNEFAEYFWQVAKPRDEVVVEASVKRGDEDLVVIQLDSYIFTGGAHGLSTTQYINWLPQTDRLLSLETMLLPKKMPAFQNQLKKQYDEWLRQNREAIQNPTSYRKKWPFIQNDNAALLKEGVAITYDPYSIAPYSFGRPTLIVPYQDLKGILRPELLPQ
jgi:hypothetical protein